MGSLNARSFDIPVDYEAVLRHVEPQDRRSDEEMIESLVDFQPVTSERNIWAFWDKGIKAMPSWQQRNVCNWIRLNGNDWTVRVLDAVPGSANNAMRFVDDGLQPAALQEDKMTGGVLGHEGQHKADLFRTALVYTYGGAYFDVGFILFCRVDDICWKRIMDPADPTEVVLFNNIGIQNFNGFVAARKGNIFVQKWQEISVRLWKGRTSTDGMHKDPLLQPVLASFAHADTGGSHEENLPVPWNVSDIGVIQDYIAHVYASMRLIMIVDCKDGFHGPKYFQKHVALLPGHLEMHVADSHPEINGIGERLFDVFLTRLDAPRDSREYQLASKIIWTLLSDTVAQAVWHCKNLVSHPSMGTLWDLPENEGKDCLPGTFGELLRYGSVHFEQCNRPVRYIKSPAPPCYIERGHLDPGPFTGIHKTD